MTGPEVRITIVPDEACPECGAYWGHPDPALDWPNRIKVDADWKCFNPGCTVAFYRDGVVLERTLSPEDEAAMHARISADMDALFARSRWISRGNTSRIIPNDAPLPDGWREGP